MIVDTVRLNRIKKEMAGFSFSRLSSKASWSVIDQAAFSGAGLFLNMALIWLLPGNGYGQFAVTFAVFLLLSGAHDSFVLEPVSVLGSSVSHEALGGYLSSLLIVHAGVTLIITITSIAALAMLPLGDLSELMIAMASMLPLILLCWTARRLCYITSETKVAGYGSFIYFASVVVLLGLASLLGSLTPAMGFLIMAVASVPATYTILLKLPFKPARITSSNSREVLRVFREHWQLGKWVGLQKVFYTASNQLGVLMTSLTVSVAAAGVLRALTFTVMPLLQITAALSSMLALPILAREYGRGNIARVHQLTRKLTMSLLLLALTYLMLLTVLQQFIAHFISMAGDMPSSWLVALKGVSPVIAASGGGAAIALRATKRVAYYPLSTAIPGIFAAIITPLLVMSWGLSGAIVSGIVVSTVATVLSIGLYKKWV